MANAGFFQSVLYAEVWWAGFQSRPVLGRLRLREFFIRSRLRLLVKENIMLEFLKTGYELYNNSYGSASLPRAGKKTDRLRNTGHVELSMTRNWRWYGYSLVPAPPVWPPGEVPSGPMRVSSPPSEIFSRDIGTVTRIGPELRKNLCKN